MSPEGVSPEIVSQTFRVAIVSLVFTPVILVLIVGLLKPGRKGHMRTEKETFHEELSLEADFIESEMRFLCLSMLLTVTTTF